MFTELVLREDCPQGAFFLRVKPLAFDA